MQAKRQYVTKFMEFTIKVTYEIQLKVAIAKRKGVK